MKKVYIATYKTGLKELTKVYANDEAEARAMAYAAFTFHSEMTYPGPRVSDVVDKVELSQDQTMSGTGIQPCVQVDTAPMTYRSVMQTQFQD